MSRLREAESAAAAERAAERQGGSGIDLNGGSRRLSVKVREVVIVEPATTLSIPPFIVAVPPTAPRPAARR